MKKGNENVNSSSLQNSSEYPIFVEIYLLFHTHKILSDSVYTAEKQVVLKPITKLSESRTREMMMSLYLFHSGLWDQFLSKLMAYLLVMIGGHWINNCTNRGKI